ncbi:MAG: sugar-binding domain-containing protein [Gemmiger formicilis]|uniref:sugar-binding domain-containing protein n=1 Tax=Gemmiger formicilis TaxID=745368 RepID=UPI003A236E3A
MQFDAVAMTAEVYLNEQKLAEHKGGYSAFCVDITDALRSGGNLLRVNVDNNGNVRLPAEGQLHLHGGIYRDVTLHVVPAAHLPLLKTARCLSGSRRFTDLSARRCEVTVEAAVVDASVTFRWMASRRALPSGRHRQAVFTLEHARLWDGLDDPYLHRDCAAGQWRDRDRPLRLPQV